MRDWSELVHRHLASVRVDERRRGEIAAELAAHLEVIALAAGANGLVHIWGRGGWTP